MSQINSRENSFTYTSPIARKQALRQYLDETRQLQEREDLEALVKLQDVIREVDDINNISLDEKAEHQDQVLMDSEMMSVSSNVIKSCTNMLNKESSIFNDVEFAEKILQYAQCLPDTEANEPNWRILAQECMPQFKLPANYFGLLDLVKTVVEEQPLEPKPEEAGTSERKVALRANRRQAIANVPAKRPEKVTELEKETVGTEIVHKIKKIIENYVKRERKPLDYFKLVIHPQRFDKTVENMLHVAFLIKDGQVRVKLDDNENLVVETTSKELYMKVFNKEIDPEYFSQEIIPINMKKWEIIKEALQITEPMIKHD